MYYNPYNMERLGIQTGIFKSFVMLGFSLIFVFSIMYQIYECNTIIKPNNDPSCVTQIYRNISHQRYDNSLNTYFYSSMPYIVTNYSVSLSYSPVKQQIDANDLRNIVHNDITYNIQMKGIINDTKSMSIDSFIHSKTLQITLSEKNRCNFDLYYGILFDDTNIRALIENIVFDSLSPIIIGDYSTGFCISQICPSIMTIVLGSLLNAINCIYFISVVFMFMMVKYYRVYHGIDLELLIRNHDRIDLPCIKDLSVI